jgi:Amt family ammonium transporter
MASAAGALTALAAWALTTGQKGILSWDLPTAMNGSLSGLVSITAGAFTLDYWSSIVTGALAGILYIKSSIWLEKWRIDDAVNAVPVHMFCGGWGVIATGLFSNPSHVEDAFGVEGRGGLFFEFGSNADSFDMIMLRNQIFGLIFICGWTIVTTLPFFYFLDYMNWFRVQKIVELGGLDAHFHGEERDLVGQADLLRALDISRTARKPVTGLQPEPIPNRPQIVSFG